MFAVEIKNSVHLAAQRCELSAMAQCVQQNLVGEFGELLLPLVSSRINQLRLTLPAIVRIQLGIGELRVALTSKDGLIVSGGPEALWCWSEDLERLATEGLPGDASSTGDFWWGIPVIYHAFWHSPWSWRYSAPHHVVQPGTGLFSDPLLLLPPELSRYKPPRVGTEEFLSSLEYVREFVNELAFVVRDRTPRERDLSELDAGKVFLAREFADLFHLEQDLEWRFIEPSRREPRHLQLFRNQFESPPAVFRSDVVWRRETVDPPGGLACLEDYKILGISYARIGLIRKAYYD